MDRKRATIRDVAAVAGVSTGTVSRVAAGNPRISNATRERVQEAMDALAYQPNAAARAMRTNVSRTIGLLVPDLSCPIFVRVAIGAEEVLSEKGYMLFAFSSNRQPQREIAFLQAARQRQMDGLILSIADESAKETVREISLMGIPLVVVDREIAVDADFVFNEHFSAMETMVAHLISLGHRRIGLVSASENVRPGRERVRAYRCVMAAAGLQIDELLIRSSGQGDDYGAAETHDLLTGPEPPTAIIAAGSDTFYGAMRAVRGLRLSIPDDISVVGADDAQFGQICGPSITMIERDMREVGRCAARMLLDRFAGVSLPSRQMVLESKIVLRNSIGPVQRGNASPIKRERRPGMHSVAASAELL